MNLSAAAAAVILRRSSHVAVRAVGANSICSGSLLSSKTIMPTREYDARHGRGQGQRTTFSSASLDLIEQPSVANNTEAVVFSVPAAWRTAQEVHLPSIRRKKECGRLAFASSDLNAFHSFSSVSVFDKQGAKKEKNQMKKAGPLLDWEAKFALLCAFKKANGHCHVPPGLVVGGFPLGGWVATQRKEYLKHRLGFPSNIINEKRVARLERQGFQWELDGEEKRWSTASLFAIGTASAALAAVSA